MVDTVGKVIDDFINLYAKPNTRDWKETSRLLSQFAKAWEVIIEAASGTGLPSGPLTSTALRLAAT
jgi:hypothetical protein